MVDCKEVSLALFWIALQETCKINILFYIHLWRSCPKIPNAFIYYTMPLFWCGKFQNTYQYKVAQFSCTVLIIPSEEQTQQYSLEDRTVQSLLKFTTRLVACFSKTIGLPMGRRGQCKPPALSIKFRTWASLNCLWVALTPYEVRRRKLFRVV
jgi:hypothetical protein